MARVTKNVVSKVTETMNEELTRQFTKEVEANLKQMAPLKSLRPDDLNLGFYQTYWHIKGEKVASIVLKFLNEGSFDKCINLHILLLFQKTSVLMLALTLNQLAYIMLFTS